MFSAGAQCLGLFYCQLFIATACAVGRKGRSNPNMDSAVRSQLIKDDGDSAQLMRVARVLPTLADLSRADILLCILHEEGRAEILAQARPHSIAPIHRSSMVGEMLTRDNAGAVFRAMMDRQYVRSQREYPHEVMKGSSSEGSPAPVVQEAYPVENSAGQVIGAVLIETNLLESERLKRRSEVFQ